MADVTNKANVTKEAYEANKADKAKADEADEADVTDKPTEADEAKANKANEAANEADVANMPGKADVANETDLANKVADTVEAVGASAANGIILTSGCCKIASPISQWSRWGWRGNEAKTDDSDEADLPDKESCNKVVEAKGHD